VLDEPTNHLDIPSREALEEALEAYEGTIVTISHDRFFLDRVATQILALDGEGNVDHYHGDYTEYHNWKSARGGAAELPASAPASESEGRSSGNVSSQKRKPAVPRSASAKQAIPASSGDESKRIKVVKKARGPDVVEAEIAEFEKRLTELSDEMSKPEIARDITRLVGVNDQYEATQRRLTELYDEWERAEGVVVGTKRK